ncbi:hypothetical protein SUNI508_06158 [Seiridium unicorne]|uniref:Uncharacterized protein n=1 Tax=Seiridium unicorne TaxID=138068 RepID=A0ABR2V274_9PEZI
MNPPQDITVVVSSLCGMAKYRVSGCSAEQAQLDQSTVRI